MDRREMLDWRWVGDGWLSDTKIVAAPTSSRKLKVLVTGGHPGDPEYGCGGTITRLTALGHDVALLYLNDGAWPPTPAPVRVEEAKKACGILKARCLYAVSKTGTPIVDQAHYDASGRSSKRRIPTPSSTSGRSITTPIIAPSSCSLIMRDRDGAQICSLLL